MEETPLEIIEFANVLNVPILKAGTHYGRKPKGKPIVISDELLDEIIEGSNECKELIRDSMKTGNYRGNNYKLTRPIPGILNLHHDDILDETMKLRTKDVDWEFGKQVIRGVPWMTQTFRNVPKDVAKSIQSHFSGRSVELLPLKNPDTGKTYPMVVRSTAFLDKHTAPAVKGQSAEDITVEFAEEDSPITVLYCNVEHQPITETQENIIMSEQQKPTEDPKLVEMAAALEAKEQELKELQNQRGQEEARITELEEARKRDADKLIELQRAQETREIDSYLKELSLTPREDSNGVKYTLAPVFAELVSPALHNVPQGIVIELAEGKQESFQETLKGIFEKLLEKALDGGLFVPMTEMAERRFKDPDTKEAPLIDRAKARAKEKDIPYDKALLELQEGEN
jgi:hypothetical protein